MKVVFEVPTDKMTPLLWRRMLGSVCTLNASKIFKHKRGTLLLIRVAYVSEKVELEWVPVERLVLSTGRRCRRFRFYDYGNHSHLLFELRSAEFEFLLSQCFNVSSR